MALQAKYQSLINLANSLGVSDLSVTEQGNVLHVNGNVPSDDAKQKLWDAYNVIDPDMRAGDLVLNIEVVGGAAVFYVVQKGDSLSKIAKSYPNTTWQKIFEENKDQIKDPNLIQIGQKLRIPS
jgi:nucleoid-associated protein YgaU